MADALSVSRVVRSFVLEMQGNYDGPGSPLASAWRKAPPRIMGRWSTPGYADIFMVPDDSDNFPTQR